MDIKYFEDKLREIMTTNKEHFYEILDLLEEAYNAGAYDGYWEGRFEAISDIYENGI